MTRAALLPAGNDPFLLAYWLRNYATWAQYVDELRVWVCGALEAEPLAYLQACIAGVPHASMEYVPHRTDHGTVLRNLLHKTKASHVMLCEDDAFVRHPGIIDECFRAAEAGGIAATTRGGYASDEVMAVATAKFGEQYAYWPCFVFVARERLIATDQDFSGTWWEAGERIFDHEMVERGGADTFVWASYQLRAMGLPETLIDNHRLSGQSVPPDAPWFHVGSLSSGHGLMYMSDISPEQYGFELDGFRQLPAGNALQRIAWWQRAWRSASGAIPDYWQRYGAGLDRFREDLRISQSEVDAYQRMTDPLITWAES